MQKRGLSGIVVSVLLVLLVMVAVAIIWFSIRPLLQRAGQQTQDELQFNSVSFTIRNIKVDSQNNMEFILQRNAGKGNVVGFVIVLEDTTKKISTITKYNTTSLEELHSILVNISAVEHGLTEDITKILVYAVGLSTDISISIVSSNPVATAGTGSGSGGGGGGGIGNQVECVVDSACDQNINYCSGICTASNTCDYGHTKADNTQCPTGGTCQAGICNTINPPSVAIQLSSCGTLNQQGVTYMLNQSVSTAGSCFTITANNVTLNLNGYNITGDAQTEDTAATDAGVYVNGYNYTIVKNGEIYDFGYGVYINAVSNATVFNISARTSGFSSVSGINSIYGIYVSSGTNVSIIRNNVSGSNNQMIDGGQSVGIYIGSIFSYVSNNYASSLTSAEGSGTGITTSSNSSVFENNIANSNSYRGTLMNSAYSNIFTNNTFEGNAQQAIYISSSAHNLFNGGLITSSGSHAVYITGASSVNNTFNNITISNSIGNDFYFASAGINGTQLVDMPQIKNVVFTGAGGTGSIYIIDSYLGGYILPASTGINLYIKRTPYGEIFVPGATGSGANLTRDVLFSNYNSLFINFTSNSGFRKAGINITLYGLPTDFVSPTIKRTPFTATPTPTACTQCTNETSLNAGTVRFILDARSASLGIATNFTVSD